MISDVLSDAVKDIDYYLNEKVFDDVYKAELRDEVIYVRDRMDSLRKKLDTPPTAEEWKNVKSP